MGVGPLGSVWAGVRSGESAKAWWPSGSVKAGIDPGGSARVGGGQRGPGARVLRELDLSFGRPSSQHPDCHPTQHLAGVPADGREGGGEGEPVEN